MLYMEALVETGTRFSHLECRENPWLCFEIALTKCCTWKFSVETHPYNASMCRVIYCTLGRVSRAAPPMPRYTWLQTANWDIFQHRSSILQPRDPRWNKFSHYHKGTISCNINILRFRYAVTYSNIHKSEFSEQHLIWSSHSICCQKVRYFFKAHF